MVKRRAKVKVTRYGGIKKHKMFKIFLGICILLLIVIGFLAFGEYFSKSIFKEGPISFVIEDECSFVMGNIIHQIKNDADCRIRCRGDCIVREREFLNHSLIEKEPCYSCECYCK